MDTTTLQFPSIRVLADFLLKMDSNRTESYDLNLLTLTAVLTAADVEIAQAHYHATIVSNP